MAGVWMPAFKWRERIRGISAYLEDEFDALYASLQNGILTLRQGGVGSDLSESGPGFLRQDTEGAEITVRGLVSGDLGTGTASADKFLRGDLTWKNHLEWYNVKDYGAVGNNSADDTSAFQQAIDAAEAAGYGTVYIPEGTYKLTATLTVNSNNISIRGAGIGVTILYVYQTTTDGIYIGPVSSDLQRISLRDFTMYAWNEGTAGDLVHIDRTNHVVMDAVELDGYYGGLWLESVIYGYFSNLLIRSNQNFTALRASSHLLRVNKNVSGSIPSELHFTNCDWRGNATDARKGYLDYCVFLQEVDGIFITNAHFGMCNTPIKIRPDTTTAQLTAITLNNVYLDNSTATQLIVEDITSYTGTMGAFLFNNIYCHNAEKGMGFNALMSAPSAINNVLIWNMEHNGIDLTKAALLSFENVRIWDINQDGSTYVGVSVGANADRCSFNHVIVEQANGAEAPYAGFDIASGATKIRATNCGFDACTYPLLDSSDDDDKYFANNWAIGGSMPMIPTEQALGTSLLLRAFSVFDTIKVGTDNNVDSIDPQSSWIGRKLTLIFTGAITVYDTSGGTSGANIKLNGAANMSATANDTLTLVYDGSYWLEIGRSVNT